MSKFELPPPEHRPASVESFKAPMVAQQHTLGPPPLLRVLLVIELCLAMLSLWRWEPEELLVPFCPALQALFSGLIAYYVYKGKNAARILAFLGAGFWIIAGIITLRTRTDLVINAMPNSTRVILLARASFELLFALYLMRGDAARYFEQKR